MQTTTRRCPENTNNKLSRMFVLIAFALLVTGCAIASASTGTYTVQPGDTLAKIASAHDTTVERLVELNQETYPLIRRFAVNPKHQYNVTRGARFS